MEEALKHSSKLPLSVIILAHQADERLAAALESAQFAQDVLVVVNTSEDLISPLRTRYSFQMIDWKEPITDFSHVRNTALQQAQHDWVLFLDSDEVVKTDSVSEIAAKLKNPTAAGYGIRRSDIFHGRQLDYGEAGQQLLVRMGQRDTLQFTGSVHEVAQVNGPIEHTSIELLHHSHPSISEFISKVSRYSYQVAQERTSTFPRLLFELLFFPPGKFLYALCIQGGIADGWHGIVYAFCMSLHSLLVRVYQYEKLFVSKS
jgi:glycosyltransferase involved in cell wall biosynthesis